MAVSAMPKGLYVAVVFLCLLEIAFAAVYGKLHAPNSPQVDATTVQQLDQAGHATASPPTDATAAPERQADDQAKKARSR